MFLKWPGQNVQCQRQQRTTLPKFTFLPKSFGTVGNSKLIYLPQLAQAVEIFEIILQCNGSKMITSELEF